MNFEHCIEQNLTSFCVVEKVLLKLTNEIGLGQSLIDCCANFISNQLIAIVDFVKRCKIANQSLYHNGAEAFAHQMVWRLVDQRLDGFHDVHECLTVEVFLHLWSSWRGC